MRRFLISMLVLFAIGIAGVVALPWLISSETVRQSLLDRAREITGREMRFSGDPRVSFSPFLGIEIQDVTFAQAFRSETDEPILSMPFLRAKLNLTAALTGKVIIDEFQFIQPKFNLKYYSSGNTSWTFPQGKVWRALQEAASVRTDTPTGESPDVSKLTNIRLGRFSVEAGTILYENELNGRNETVTNFNGSLLWPNTRAGWTFAGNGVWRGDVVNVNLTAATPIMLLAGGSTKLKVEAQSETLNLDFEGEANRFSDIFFSGAISASSPSLRKMVEFFGGSSGIGSSFLSFTANGDLSGTLSDVQFENAEITLDGNEYMGGLRLLLDQTKKGLLSGTLATSSLDLAPYVAGFQAPDGFSSTLDFLGQTDLDLRMSATNIVSEDPVLKDFAGSISVKENTFKLDVGNASLGDSQISGSATIEKETEDFATSFSLDASRVNLDDVPFLKEYVGIVPAGISNVKLRLAGLGNTVPTFKNQMNGEFSLTMKEGVLNGLNFDDVRLSLEEDDQTQESIKIGNSSAGTAVKDFLLNVTINRGVGWIQNSNFGIEEYDVGLTGKADLRSGNLGVWGILKSSDEPNALESSQFLLGGTMEQPLYVPQPRQIAPSAIGPLEPSQSESEAKPKGSSTN